MASTSGLSSPCQDSCATVSVQRDYLEDPAGHSCGPLRTVGMVDTYRWLAPVYETVSAERLVYRAGRVAGIEALRLKPGDRVLDVGCGTGLNLPLLVEGIGPSGSIVGLDASRHMLRVARRTATRLQGQTSMLQGDASDPGDPVWDKVETLAGDHGFDAVICAYALSLMHPWRGAWTSIRRHTVSGARIAVVDMALPSGPASWARPLAAAACWLGGSDPSAHPWTAVERDCREIERRELRGGHIQVWSGVMASR